eukprot:182299-Rhodomonas_salina.1
MTLTLKSLSHRSGTGPGPPYYDNDAAGYNVTVAVYSYYHTVPRRPASLSGGTTSTTSSRLLAAACDSSNRAS